MSKTIRKIYDYDYLKLNRSGRRLHKWDIVKTEPKKFLTFAKNKKKDVSI
jgi:hypothetical protein